MERKIALGWDQLDGVFLSATTRSCHPGMEASFSICSVGYEIDVTTIHFVFVIVAGGRLFTRKKILIKLILHALLISND